MLQTVSPSPSPQPLTYAERTARIRELNDRFRTSHVSTSAALGRKIYTSGIDALGLANVVAIAEAVMAFNAFDEGNDPHGEHDFGAFEFKGEKIFWKIDYYDKACRDGSPDPADPAVTCRLLTVLLASEY